MKYRSGKSTECAELGVINRRKVMSISREPSQESSPDKLLYTLRPIVLVSVVLGLIRSFDGYTQILCLLSRECRQFYADLFKM